MNSIVWSSKILQKLGIKFSISPYIPFILKIGNSLGLLEISISSLLWVVLFSTISKSLT